MEITKEKLMMYRDLFCFLRTQDYSFIVPYNNIYCAVYCNCYNIENVYGLSFELMDNFGDLVISFDIDETNKFTTYHFNTKQDVLNVLNEIEKVVTIFEYNASHNILGQLSLNCCELNEQQLLFKYGKYFIEVENCEGDALVSIRCDNGEYPMGYILVYVLNNKLYSLFYDLEEGTNQKQIKMLMAATMQNLIGWCTI
jgi:hypothetical protein|nr:MAG TPA: hypothetical protein [Caudoviricetes sp.]